MNRQAIFAGAIVLGAGVGVALMALSTPDTGPPAAPLPLASQERTDDRSQDPADDGSQAAAATEGRVGSDSREVTGELRPFVTDPMNRGRAARAPDNGRYRPNVYGLQRLFGERADAVTACMDRDGPAALPDESKVMIRAHFVPDTADASIARIERIESVRDPESRYQFFNACLTKLFSDVPFTAPPGGTSSANWAVSR